MAKIYEEVIVIKFSKLIRENDQPESISSEELESNLAAVAQELVGTGVIVEVEKA